MYIVELKNETGTCEKEFARLDSARRAAAQAANDGVVLLDSALELNTDQCLFPVRSVRVYRSDCPGTDIDY